MSDSVDGLFQRYGPAYRWLIVATGMCGVVAMVLSATIANVAVPSVMGAFGVGQDQAQWLATAFIAAMTAGQLLNAYIIAAFGQRLGYTLLILVFLLGTAVAALSPTMGMLAIGRMIQGFCAGAVQPLVLVTVFSVFPVDRRGTAMGIYGMVIMLAPGLGPVVGGIAIDYLSWRHIFIIPVPLCLAGLVLGLMFMPGKSDKTAPPPLFDWLGFGLLCGGILCLLSYIANGQRLGWTTDGSVLTIVCALVFLGAFVWIQVRAREPLLDFTLFRNPQFASAVAVGVVFGAGNFGVSYAVPVFVQTVMGFTATKAGFVLLPAGIMLILLFPFTGRLTDKLPHHLLIITGLVTFAAGAMLMVGADSNTPLLSLILFVMIGRFGQSLVLPAMNASALRAMASEQLNRASGGINFMRQLGGALGVNGLVALTEQRIYFHGEALAATQTAGNPASRDLLDGIRGLLGTAGVPEPLHQPGALNYLSEVIHAQASVFGFQDGFLVLAIVFLLAMVPAWILGRTKPSSA